MASGNDQNSASTKKTATRGSARKHSAKTPALKKQPVEKPSAKKQPAASRPRGSAPRTEGRPRPSAAEVGQLALAQLSSMTGNDVESVTGLERTEDGWKVEAVVLELRRVPNTTDVLAAYEVLLDSSGELQGYRRTARYARGDTRSDQ